MSSSAQDLTYGKTSNSTGERSQSELHISLIPACAQHDPQQVIGCARTRTTICKGNKHTPWSEMSRVDDCVDAGLEKLSTREQDREAVYKYHEAAVR